MPSHCITYANGNQCERKVFRNGLFYCALCRFHIIIKNLLMTQRHEL